MGRFIDTYYEGRNPWMVFTIKKNESRWSFRNTETGKLNYIKVSEKDAITTMQRFLEDLGATPGSRPKTMGQIDYKKFAEDVVGGKKANVYVRSGKFETIQKTWLLGEKN